MTLFSEVIRDSNSRWVATIDESIVLGVTIVDEKYLLSWPKEPLRTAKDTMMIIMTHSMVILNEWERHVGNVRQQTCQLKIGTQAPAYYSSWATQYRLKVPEGNLEQARKPSKPPIPINWSWSKICIWASGDRSWIILSQGHSSVHGRILKPLFMPPHQWLFTWFNLNLFGMRCIHVRTFLPFCIFEMKRA